MIGTSHIIESGFMNQLPILFRNAAMDLLISYRLKHLVEMYQTQAPQDLKNRFTLTDEQWKITLRAVILTKISYFNITEKYPISHINRLLEIINYILATKQASPIELSQMTEQEYPFFSSWLKTLHNITLIKYKKTQYHTKIH